MRANTASAVTSTPARKNTTASTIADSDRGCRGRTLALCVQKPLHVQRHHRRLHIQYTPAGNLGSIRRGLERPGRAAQRLLESSRQGGVRVHVDALGLGVCYQDRCCRCHLGRCKGNEMLVRRVRSVLANHKSAAYPPSKSLSLAHQ